MSDGEYRIEIRTAMDVARAVMQARKCAQTQGFDESRKCAVATAMSELGNNIIKYALRGEVIIRPVMAGTKRGVEIQARDQGPGIEDIEEAMKDHVSSGGTLGLGLPGVKRMMDEFNLESERGKGTTVTARKWK